jgi:nucleoside-diphosphate-sugar epimerase
VLVTGASGFLGRPLVSALRGAGYDVVTVGRAPAATPSATHLVADLLIRNEMDAAVRRAAATHLVHLAWHVDHHDFWTSPLNDAWADASAALAHAFLANGGRHVVAAGSCAEYAPAGAAVLTEQSSLGPGTRYGQAKVDAHRRISAACAGAGGICSWGRIFIPYGPGDHPQRLVPSLIDVCRGRRPRFAISPGDVRDFIHVDDVATSMLCLLQHGVSGAVNIATGIPSTIASVAMCVARACGVSPEVVLPVADTSTSHGISPTDRSHWLVGEPSTLISLGWRPAVTLDEGICSQVQADAGSC